MDSAINSLGAETPMEGGESSTDKSSPGEHAPRERSQEKGSLGGSAIPPPKGSNRRDQRRELTRFLWAPVYSSQIIRGVEASAQPQSTKRFSEAYEIQDGVGGFDKGSHPQSRLGSFIGPGRCILPYSDPQVRPEMASLQPGRQGLSVPGSSIWPFHSSLGIHQADEGSGYFDSFQGDSSKDVPRRLADPSLVQASGISALVHPVETMLSARTSDQLGQVGDFSGKAVPVLGDEFRYGVLDSGPVRGANFQVAASHRQSLRQTDELGQSFVLPIGHHGVSGPHSQFGTSAQTQAATRVVSQVGTTLATLGGETCNDRVVSSSSLAMGEQELVGRGGEYSPPRSHGGVIHRCVTGRLGSPCGTSHSLGHLDRVSDIVAHQPLRDGGSKAGISSVPQLASWQENPSMHGQLDCGILSEQARGLALAVSVAGSGGDSAVVSAQSNLSQGQTRARKAKRAGRCLEQSTLDPPDGMDAHTQSSATGMAALAQANDRPVCDSVQCKATNVYIASEGPGRMGSGRDVMLVEKSGSLCVPPDTTVAKGNQEGSHRPSGSHSDRSILARPTMVRRATQTVSRSTSEAQTWTGGPNSAKIRNPSRESSFPELARVEAVQRSLRSLGVSDEAAKILQLSHRHSTRNVYDSHWRKWISWCADNQVDPLNPSSTHLLNFLAFLSSVKKLSASAVKAHRSAIASTLRQTGGPSFENDPHLRDLSRGLAFLQASSPRRVPAWDLFLVLKFLRGPPFEPLKDASLKDLYRKTAFLISLASARRCSEVHALSGLDCDISSNRDLSFSLKFLPEFIAKNQNLSDPSPAITIKPLIPFLPDSSDPERVCCPARALRYYLRRSRPLRHRSQRRLFISPNSDYARDIKKSSLSRWMSDIVKEAYKAEGREIPASQARAHEIRAWATSMAFHQSFALSQILEAAYWHSPSSFISYYLRDVTAVRQDGRHGLSSLICANQLVQTPRL